MLLHSCFSTRIFVGAQVGLKTTSSDLCIELYGSLVYVEGSSLFEWPLYPCLLDSGSAYSCLQQASNKVYIKIGKSRYSMRRNRWTSLAVCLLDVLLPSIFEEDTGKYVMLIEPGKHEEALVLPHSLCDCQIRLKEAEFIYVTFFEEVMLKLLWAIFSLLFSWWCFLNDS